MIPMIAANAAIAKLKTFNSIDLVETRDDGDRSFRRIRYYDTCVELLFSHDEVVVTVCRPNHAECVLGSRVIPSATFAVNEVNELRKIWRAVLQDSDTYSVHDFVETPKMSTEMRAAFDEVLASAEAAGIEINLTINAATDRYRLTSVLPASEFYASVCDNRVTGQIRTYNLNHGGEWQPDLVGGAALVETFRSWMSTLPKAA